MAMRFNRNVSIDDMKGMSSAKIVRRWDLETFLQVSSFDRSIKFIEMELVDDDVVETIVTIYYGNRCHQSAPIQLFAELANVEPAKDPTPLGEEHEVQDPFGNLTRCIVIRNDPGAHMSLTDPDVAYATEFSKYPDILPAHRLAVDSKPDELFIGKKFATKEEYVFSIKRYVVRDDNICIIFDRGNGIIIAIRCSDIPWRFVYCIQHIEANFQREYKNVLWSHKKGQSFDDEFRYDHITTNLLEAVNSMLRKTRHLPISSMFLATFYRLATLIPRMGLKQVN
ncbi:hypothetical protein GOBAR_DD03668 [Gossypium barbadense]|nr:hypothetical protein GOBAR_DD03668 [Gossypium barbadense]